MKRFALVLIALAGIALVAEPGQTAPRSKASVEVGDAGTVSADGRTATVQVGASCARGWTVLEAFVTVSQPQADAMGGLPLSCTGRTQAFTVGVSPLDGAFTPGPAQVSAFVLIERRGRVQQAQDSEQVPLVVG